MMIEERWKGALALSLLWVALMAVTLFFFDLVPKVSWLLTLFIPLLIMVFGLIIYLGGYVLITGVNTMTKEERSRYDMNKITSFMGIFLILLSYIGFLMTISFVFFVVFIAAVLAAFVYLFASKRFKAAAPAES